MTTQVTMRDLLEAGVHFGHQTNRWDPKMRPYIFGARNGIHIVDLSQTVRMFAEAYDFLVHVASKGNGVMFVGTKKQAQDAIKEQADRAGQFYVVNRWLGGTLTNLRTIKNSTDRLKELDRMQAEGSFARYTKKEVLMFARERERLENNVGGIRDMDNLPGALFIVDPKKEDIAVKEANKLGIPIVAVCDTNCDPTNIDYVIPGNDDAIRAIRLFATAVAEACLEGAKASSARREESARESARNAADFNAPAKREAKPEPEVQRVSRPEQPRTDTGEAEA
ncbi:MAG: 30S ribosomal protein S2 [Bradymonadaceae bacterium]|nr:30S ribosomal protein S2 [Lujinxingiaceae bacterium]